MSAEARVLNDLSSKKAEKRAEAERQIATWDTERLLQAVEAQAKQFRQGRRIVKALAIGIGSLFALMLVLFIVKGVHGQWDFNWLAGFSGMAGVAMAGTQAHKNGAKKLAESDDIRIVGPMAEALQLHDKDVRADAESALIRLLPRLQASDAALLDDAQRDSLNRTLLKSKNTELILAILKAYEQVGDSKAVPTVEKLAAREGRTVAEAALSQRLPHLQTSDAVKETPVQEAARHCLDHLRLKVAKEQESQTLLRAANGNLTSSDVLLRPAFGVHPTDSLELLRASLLNEDNQHRIDSDLVLEILDDLRRNGDSRALPYIEQLAADRTTSSYIREAAQETLLVLNAGR